jgi:choline dehydrogenase
VGARDTGRARLSRIREGRTNAGEERQTDAELRRYIAATAKTDYHPVGTCKMGRDELSVVDAQLCVHGVDALRVIDSSVMPAIVGGNTQAPTKMIRAKGATMILNDRSVVPVDANELSDPQAA